MSPSKKHAHPLRYQLRVVAGKLETGSLTPKEITGLAKVLRKLADGESLDDIFEVKSPAHRPASANIDQRLYDVELLRLDKKHGGGGLKKAEAIAEVAKRHFVSTQTIETDLKSDRAKVIREDVRRQHYSPFELEHDQGSGGCQSRGDK